MLPHTGLSWLMKVALQIRIRGPLHIFSRSTNGSKGKYAIFLKPERASALNQQFIYSLHNKIKSNI